MEYIINPYRRKYGDMYKSYNSKDHLGKDKDDKYSEILTDSPLDYNQQQSKSKHSDSTKLNHMCLPDINQKTDDRKLNLIRKPCGSRRSDNSRFTLYTITSCSEIGSTTASESSKMQNNDAEVSSSEEYQKTDNFSKPTNFATIQSSNELPRISLNSLSRTSVDKNKRRMLKSRTSNFPDIEKRYLAKKNWINAEIKTFPMWHDLNKGKTVLRNSLPSLEMIQIEKMAEEMRHTKQTNPSALQFDMFAKRVRKENEEKHIQHLMSNPRYNTMLEFENF